MKALVDKPFELNEFKFSGLIDEACKVSYFQLVSELNNPVLSELCLRCFGVRLLDPWQEFL